MKGVLKWGGGGVTGLVCCGSDGKPGRKTASSKSRFHFKCFKQSGENLRVLGERGKQVAAAKRVWQTCRKKVSKEPGTSQKS